MCGARHQESLATDPRRSALLDSCNQRLDVLMNDVCLGIESLATADRRAFSIRLLYDLPENESCAQRPLLCKGIVHLKVSVLGLSRLLLLGISEHVPPCSAVCTSEM